MKNPSDFYYSLMYKIPEVRKGSREPPKAIVEVFLIRSSGLGLKRNPNTPILIQNSFVQVVFRYHGTDMPR